MIPKMLNARIQLQVRPESIKHQIYKTAKSDIQTDETVAYDPDQSVDCKLQQTESFQISPKSGLKFCRSLRVPPSGAGTILYAVYL